MTLRLDMIRAATKARDILADACTPVSRFLRDQQNPDGGFRGRSAFSDLYYTVFGSEALIALDGHTEDTAHVKYFLENGHTIENLDLVHLACLGRCWASVLDCHNEVWPTSLHERIATRLNQLQCQDRSFTTQTDSQNGNVYGCFMALGLYQDLKLPVDNPDAILNCLARLSRQNGGYANDTQTHSPSTPATAAAITICHYLDESVPDQTLNWLQKQVHEQGGFAAVSEHAAFIGPDLLSTATAIHALSLIQANLSHLRESCLDYLDTLWAPEGGFCGNLMDRTLDCEYTYYGLLALGHLSQTS